MSGDIRCRVLNVQLPCERFICMLKNAKNNEMKHTISFKMLKLKISNL